MVLLMLIAPDQPSQNQYSPEYEDSSDNQGNASGPSSILLRIRNKLKAYRKKSEDREYRKEQRERWTVLAIFAAAIIALFQWDALNRTDNHIDGQLEVMKTEAAYRRYELAANMQLNIVYPHNIDSWDVTPVWQNAGKTDALQVAGWVDLKFVPSDKLTSTDFVGIPTGKQLSKKETVIAGETAVYRTQTVGLSQVADPAHDVPVIFGYIEYEDIYETLHTVNFCRALDFTTKDRTVAMNLPLKLPLPCESRTEVKKQKEK